MLKKLLFLVGLSAVAYFFVRDRLSTDEFEFTEVPSPEAQKAAA